MQGGTIIAQPGGKLKITIELKLLLLPPSVEPHFGEALEAGSPLQVLLRVDLVAAVVHPVHVQKVGRFSAPACNGAHVQEVADPLPHPSSWFKKLVTW